LKRYYESPKSDILRGMPLYTFEGRKEQTGELVQGRREAGSHDLLGQDLLSEGVLLTRYEVKKQREAGRGLLGSLFGRVPILERVMFARYFGLMLRAGLDVKRSLAALEEQTKSKAMKQTLEGVYQDVEKGKSLAEAMEKFPQVFPALFLSFIRVGEKTGRLQESLFVLADQLRKEFELRRAVRGALLYPLVILIALVAVGFAMLVFVIPRLAEVFAGFDVELPLATRLLLGLGTFFEKSWYLVIIGGVILLIGAALAWRITRVKSSVLHALLYVPVLGPIMQQISMARFCRSLGSLLSSGVTFTESLDILGKNTPHPTYGHILRQSEEHVKQGKPLSDFLYVWRRFIPVLVVNVVKIGEETGELDKVLSETADFYEGEVEQVMKNLTSIIEPILMVVIGLAVGALAVSVISPIYNLVDVI
jgi:type IV pilus assembly protein PilC